jgi:hypothetical protein
MTEVIECLSSQQEAPSSISSTAKKKKNLVVTPAGRQHPKQWVIFLNLPGVLFLPLSLNLSYMCLEGLVPHGGKLPPGNQLIL